MDVMHWGFHSSVFRTFSTTDVSFVVLCLGSILKPACCWTCWTQPVVAVSVSSSFVSFFRGSKVSVSSSLITDAPALLNKGGTSALCGIGLDSLLAVEVLGLVLDQTLYIQTFVAIDISCAARWPHRTQAPHLVYDSSVEQNIKYQKVRALMWYLAAVD